MLSFHPDDPDKPEPERPGANQSTPGRTTPRAAAQKRSPLGEFRVKLDHLTNYRTREIAYTLAFVTACLSIVILHPNMWILPILVITAATSMCALLVRMGTPPIVYTIRAAAKPEYRFDRETREYVWQLNQRGLGWQRRRGMPLHLDVTELAKAGVDRPERFHFYLLPPDHFEQRNTKTD